MVTTLAQAAKAAIDVQDACNLSGVVRSFSEILSDVLWPEARRLNQGTDWVNTHPISVLFSDKIGSLTGATACADCYETFRPAYAECQRLASEVSHARS